MYSPFSLTPQGRGPFGCQLIALWIFDIPERAINGAQSICPARHRHAADGMMPLIPRIVGVEAADIRCSGTVARGVVSHAKMQRFQAVTCATARDILYIRHPQGGLDQCLDTYPVLE